MLEVSSADQKSFNLKLASWSGGESFEVTGGLPIYRDYWRDLKNLIPYEWGASMPSLHPSKLKSAQNYLRIFEKACKRLSIYPIATNLYGSCSKS